MTAKLERVSVPPRVVAWCLESTRERVAAVLRVCIALAVLRVVIALVPEKDQDEAI